MILYRATPCIALTAILASVVAGAADELPPGSSVADRDRPELDAPGMPFGAFRLYPSLDIAVGYDSNLYADDAEPQDDVVTVFGPSLRLESDWTRHALDLAVAAETARYEDSAQEDYRNLLADAELRLDLGRTTEVRLQGGAHDLHEERHSPDDVDGLEPTAFRRRDLAILAARRHGQVLLDGRLRHTRHDFDDVPGAQGPINNDDRDRRQQALDLRAGWQVSRDLDLLLRVETDRRDYDLARDDNGYDRASRGVAAGLGIAGAVGGAGYVEAFAGYAERRYDDPQLADAGTPWFDARYVWNLSGLTTLTLRAGRTIDETTFAPASGYRATRYGVQLEHELLRNLLVTFSAFRQDDGYAGVARRDRRSGAGLRIEYLTNRYLRIALEANRRARRSVLDGRESADFDIDTAMLTFTLQR